jgi:pimeloyl-ACP methyl ester carboxylesterase
MKPLRSTLLTAAIALAGFTTLATDLHAATPHHSHPESAMTAYAYDSIPTQFVVADNGVRYAYRRFGTASGVPLVFIQRFRGTMDHWDPALLEVIAKERPVIVFDNAGVGASGGEVPSDLAGAAQAAAAFIDALGLKQIDALGWSMGGAVLQLLALERPGLVRRMVLAGTGPGGVPDAPRPPEKVWQVAAKPVNDDEDFLYLFFTDSPASREAGLASLRRLDRRLSNSKAEVKPASWKSQAGAIAAWGMGKGAAYPRLSEITAPVLVANGAHDVMVHAYNSYAMAQKLPNARLVLYPDAGHGFLFQHAQGFGREVNEFLR